MRMLQLTSAVAAACSVLMWCFFLVQPALPVSASAAVDAGFAVFVGGMLVGLLASFVGLVAGATLGPRPAWRLRILAGGHALTLVLTGVVVLWAFVFPQSGWELLALPGGVHDRPAARGLPPRRGTVVAAPLGAAWPGPADRVIPGRRFTRTFPAPAPSDRRRSSAR